MHPVQLWLIDVVSYAVETWFVNFLKTLKILLVSKSIEKLGISEGSMFGPMLFYHIVIDTLASQRVLHLMCSYSIIAILMNYCTALALQRVQCWHLFYSLSIIVIDFHTVYLAMKFVNRSLLVKVKKQRKCCVVERRIMFQCKNQTKCPVCVHVSIQ